MYVDDIIFGSDEEVMSQSFALVMQKEFEMSLLGELTYFLGLQTTEWRRYLLISNIVLQADSEEVWHGRCETSMYPHGYMMQS